MQTSKAIFSIDVEEWYHAAVIEKYVPRSQWAAQPLRLAHSMRILERLLEQQDYKATLFCLASLPKTHHALLRTWAEQGHEIASHGVSHTKLNVLSRVDLLAELRDSKRLLEDITGTEVRGFRAPNFSITDTALECLQEAGYQYDSSLFDLRIHKSYGKLEQHRVASTPYFIREGLMEFPLSVLPAAHFRLPWSGGAYFRHFPANIFLAGAQKLAKSGYFHFYIHPWEIDTAHPVPPGMRRVDRTRHFRNIEKTERRLYNMFKAIPFGTVSEYLQTHPQASWH